MCAESREGPGATKGKSTTKCEWGEAEESDEACQESE